MNVKVLEKENKQLCCSRNNGMIIRGSFWKFPNHDLKHDSIIKGYCDTNTSVTVPPTWEVERANPPSRGHGAVVVHVQVGHPLVVLLQHEEYRVQEVDQLADVEEPAGVEQPHRVGVHGDVDRSADPVVPRTAGQKLPHHVGTEDYLRARHWWSGPGQKLPHHVGTEDHLTGTTLVVRTWQTLPHQVGTEDHLRGTTLVVRTWVGYRSWH